MKIEAIRGENLASLVGRFELDFMQGPLAGAGLFAITGPTGAGKSTLLDAMCLALYGRYPRLPEGRGEKMIDVSGKEVATTDEGNILSRGHGSGEAQVDFVGKDGKRYRAIWRVRRAQEKANGKLQTPERALVELKTGRTLAEKSAVKDEVERLCELSFDQFQRTVLLAQGKFDEFLKARTSERAALLEKITGTEVYTQISQKVFEGYREKQSAERQLADRVESKVVLGEEERRLKEKEGAQWRQKAELLESEVQEIERQLALWEKLATRLEELKAEEKAGSAVAAQNLALEEGRKRLETYKALELHRDSFERAKQAKAKLTELEGRVDRLADATEKYQKAAQAAGEHAREMKERRLTVEAAIDAARPEWEQAEQLDLELKGGEASEQSAEEAAIQARRAEEESRGKRDRDEVASKLIVEQLQEEEAWLVENAYRSAWEVEIGALNLLAKQVEQAQRKGIGDPEARLKELEASVMELRNRLQAIDELWGEYDANDAQERLLEAQRSLGQLKEIRQARETASKEAAVARLAGEEEHEAGAEAERHRRQREIESNELEELQIAARVANASIGEVVEQLREQLSEESPCPVCGSKEHPYRKDDEGLRRLAEQLAKRREEKKQQVEALAIAVQQASNREAAARATREAAERRREEAEDRERQAGLNWKPSGEELEAILPMREREVGELEATWRQWQQAQNDKQEDQKRHGELEQDYREIGEWVAKRREAVLALKGLGVEVEAGKATNEILRIKHAVEEYVRRKTEVDPLRIASANLGAAAAASRSQWAQAQTIVEERSKALMQCKAEVEILRGKRKVMLGGLAVRVHRKQLEDELRTVSQGSQQADVDEAEKTSGFKNTSAQLGEARREMMLAQDEREKARREFEGRCKDAGFELREAAQILREGIEADVEKQILDMDRRLAQAHGRLEKARVSAEAMGKECEGIAARQDLEVKQGEYRKQRAEAEGEVGKTVQLLKQDELLSRERTELERQLAVAKKEKECWAEVNAAIGSASGDKFKNLVQGLTLEHLVRLANLHLEGMAPRYRLECSAVESLGLQVKDREMTEEVRAVSTLSGGERFLVSLALALGLSGLEGKGSFVDSLFIDEGFGSLDEQSLEQVMTALEALPGGGKRVGVISHVEAMKERIAIQVRVRKKGSGRSVVEIEDRLAWGMVGG